MKNLLIVIFIAFVALHLQAADRAPAVVAEPAQASVEGSQGAHSTKKDAAAATGDQAKGGKEHEELAARDLAQLAAAKKRSVADAKEVSRQYKLEALAALENEASKETIKREVQEFLLGTSGGGRAARAIYESARWAKMAYDSDPTEENRHFLVETYIFTSQFIHDNENKLDIYSASKDVATKHRMSPQSPWREFYGLARELTPYEKAAGYEKENAALEVLAAYPHLR